MNKYFYFTLGYITALMTLLLASCTLSPLQADYDTQGHSETFPLYVKAID